MSSKPVPPVLVQTQFPPEIREVLEKLKKAGHRAYLVGGLVRDLLLGKTGGDYDVATSARAEQVMKLFRRVIPTGIQHGTVTVLARSHKVEVTTFRGEGAYVDGRRPETVVFLENVVDDLARRDFTINAMAYDPIDGEFVDPFGGETDLRARLVRCVGRPTDRFSEDGLRPLRAVRFASVLDFEIDPPTRDAIPATMATFDKIAHERIREEVSKLLAGPHPGRGVRLLAETELLPRVFPEVPREAEGFPRTLARVDACPPTLTVRLAAVLWDVEPAGAEVALERLRYSRAEIDTVVNLLRMKRFALEPHPDDASVRRGMSRAGRVLVPGLLALGHAEARASGIPGLAEIAQATEAAVERVLNVKSPLTVGELALDGKAVMKILGSVPGPKVGEALRFLLALVLEDPARNTPEILEAALRAWERPQADG